MHLSWPLVGRSKEMREVDSAISAPEIGGILICGSAGVGKSRLAREALSVAKSNGWETRWTVGTSSARDIPLGAFTAWAPSGIPDTVSLLRGVIESLTARTSGRGVVLAVDDAHLLDDLSTFVVHQIVARSAAKVILTVRGDAPIPAAVQEIWKVAQFDRLDIAPLPPDDTTDLLSAALGGPVATDAAERLWKLTHGNALYLQSIVEQEVADGRLVQEQQCWRWTGNPIVPPGLVEMVESRIGDLSESFSDVIDVLAAAEPLELSMLTRMTGAAAVEEADTRGLITVEPAGGGLEVRLAHPLYGEVRRRSAPPTRLRRLRGRVASELAASRDADDLRTIVRRAALSVDSDLPPDTDLLVTAANGAVWLADLSLADRLAWAAVDAGAGPEAPFVRAHALSWLGRGREAETVLGGIRSADLSSRQRAWLAFLRASNMLWALGDPSRAKEIIDEASRLAPADDRTYIDAFLTVYWFATDQPEMAVQASKDLVLEDLPVVCTEISWALSQIAADAGRVTEAVDVAEQGYAAATRALDAPHMRFNIADAHVSALLFAGRVADALEVAERTQGQAASLPGDAQLLGAAVAGRAELGAGDLQKARALLRQAVGGLLTSHAAGWGHRYRIAHVLALAMSGASDEAVAEISAVDGVQREFRSLDFERSLARAWVAASQGAVSEAIAIAGEAAERSRSVGRFAEEVMCLQTATQFGDRTRASRLSELGQIVEGPRAGLAARFAAALRDDNAAELASVSDDFEHLGDVVTAIDAAAHAAMAYRRKDKRGSALGCSTRADALAARSGAVTPALRQATEALPFTARETEIVMLIGEELSNRAIAERLTLSVRTVESYVYRAMAKTGTSRREDLAALLPRRQSGQVPLVPRHKRPG